MIEFLLQRGEAILYALATMLFGWIGWSIKTRFVPREDHNKLELRVAQLENTIGNLPSAKEINALRGQLSEVGTELKVFNQKQVHAEENLRRLQVQLDRMDTYLRGNAGGNRK